MFKEHTTEEILKMIDEVTKEEGACFVKNIFRNRRKVNIIN